VKIPFVTASISRQAGGLFESVRGLARAVADPLNQVTVLGIEDHNSQTDRAAWNPVGVQCFKHFGPAQFAYAPALKKALLETSGDLVMSHGLWMYTSVAVHSWHRKTRRPYIVHPHGMLDEWAVRHSACKKRLALSFYERDHLRDAACVRALSEAEADSFRNFGLSNPICVIPNGIDLPEPGAAESGADLAPWSTVVDRGTKALLYLGRLHPKKGLVNLLRAWAGLWNSRSREAKSWVLAIAGWDQNGHQAELKKLANELGLPWADVRSQGVGGAAGEWSGQQQHRNSGVPPCVVFVGPQFHGAKGDCYRNCEALILPSLSEGQPMAVLEAWAYGKPVVITAACNLAEAFTAGAAWRISTTPETITSELTEFLSLSEASRRVMGANGRSLVSQRFRWAKIGVEMKQVQEWVLGGGLKPACVQG
jgi:glycosyltransferase involved in cell wall biosynthesis